MINIDRAIDSSYGWPTYYLGDNTTCDNIEIVGCKFKTYAKADVSSGYYPSPAIGTHDANGNSNSIKIHDCVFEGDWVASGQERQWPIRFYGSHTNCKVYNNTFKAATANLSSKPLGVCLQGTTKSNFTYNNIFINHSSDHMVASSNDKDRNMIHFNNYCVDTSTNGVITDSATMNLSGGILSLE